MTKALNQLGSNEPTKTLRCMKNISCICKTKRKQRFVSTLFVLGPPINYWLSGKIAWLTPFLPTKVTSWEVPTNPQHVEPHEKCLLYIYKMKRKQRFISILFVFGSPINYWLSGKIAGLTTLSTQMKLLGATSEFKQCKYEPSCLQQKYSRD